MYIFDVDNCRLLVVVVVTIAAMGFFSPGFTFKTHITHLISIPGM